MLLPGPTKAGSSPGGRARPLGTCMHLWLSSSCIHELFSADAAFLPRGVNKNYPGRPSAGRASFSSDGRHTGTAPRGWSTKPASSAKGPKIPIKLREVGPEGGEENQTEQVVGSQVGSGLSNEPPLTHEDRRHDLAAPKLTPYHLRIKEESCELSGGSLTFENPAEHQDVQQPHVPHPEWVEKEREGEGEELVQEESSASETEAVIEPDFESRTSSPVSEYEPEETLFHEVVGANPSVELMQEGCLDPETYETDVDDKLYPDGEEMDTYDRAMERKVDPEKSNDPKMEEEKWQHAEPEEDISSRDQRPEDTERTQDLFSQGQQTNTSIPPPTDRQVGDGAPALPPHEDEEDEEEDSQNVSVSWRTELESDSYAQDNTLADPRPLIRYKSDEADGAARASHGDESKSSEGEQEKKVEEMEKWSEDKAERFGTMEDLREEAEGELDEEYDLGYTHTGDRTPGQEAEQDGLLDDAEELIRGVQERPSEPKRETQDLISPAGSAEVGDEELETDRFDNSTEDTEEEDMFPPEDPYLGVVPDPALTDQPASSLDFDELTATDAEVQNRVQGPSQDKDEDVSLVTHVDETENQPIGRPETEDISCLVEPTLVGVSSEERTPAESQQHLQEKVADSQHVPQTAESWEVPRNLREEPGSAESSMEDATSDHQQQPLNICPNPGADDISVVKSSAEVVKTNRNDSSLHGFFNDMKNDYWVSSLEAGATNQPDDACYEAVERTGQGLGFADALVWGGLDDTKMVKWSSGVDIDPPKGLIAKEKQENPEVKQLLVHSEESEVEAESWSSGEEPV